MNKTFDANATDNQIKTEVNRITANFQIVAGREHMPEEMNLGKYPLLHIDLDELNYGKRPDGTESAFVEGSLCKIKTQSDYGYYHHCWSYYQYDSYANRGVEFGIQQGGSMISSSYGLGDILEDYENATAVEIKPSQEIRILVTSKRVHVGFLVKAWVSKSLDEDCASPVELLTKPE